MPRSPRQAVSSAPKLSSIMSGAVIQSVYERKGIESALVFTHKLVQR